MELVAGSVGNVESLAQGHVIAIDLGFSATQRSTGLAVSRPGTQRIAGCFTFGGAIAATLDALHESAGTASLILEAPLSFFFSSSGNPLARPFEKRSKPKGVDRNWYVGPGASTALAGAFFVRSLSEAAAAKSASCLVHVFEGFVTFKESRTRHHEDAALLLEEFLQRRVHPIEVPVGGFARSVFELAGIVVTGSNLPAIVGIKLGSPPEA